MILAVTSENGGKTNDQKLQTHRGQFFMLRGITSKNNDPNVHLGIGREKKRDRLTLGHKSCFARCG